MLIHFIYQSCPRVVDASVHNLGSERKYRFAISFRRGMVRSSERKYRFAISFHRGMVRSSGCGCWHPQPRLRRSSSAGFDNPGISAHFLSKEKDVLELRGMKMSYTKYIIS